ncbi:MAG: 4Fe-4S ferredoxin [Desulfovibrio sp.]|jgi:ferredoxin|nr:4Fe-4S ferredoxin [Desulfovibrio sp.]
MPQLSPKAAAAWLAELAASFMKSPENDLHMPEGHEPAFGLPLVGFAAGDDPLWDAYKEHVGPFHWTPMEAFALRYPQEKGGEISSSELVVMSWILPQTEATRRDHVKEKEMPAHRWARARIFGEEFVNNGLRKYILSALEAKGIQAAAPMLLKEWTRMPSEKYVIASTWSERHAAHAAGLGTFGLCDGLITPVGKAMRTGSVIVRLPVAINKRPYANHREYCLYFSSGSCGVCIQRCPAGALSFKGHDKIACRDYLQNITAPYVTSTWHFKGYGCGLCQVGVPCEKGIPKAKIRSRRGQEVRTARCCP